MPVMVWRGKYVYYSEEGLCHMESGEIIQKGRVKMNEIVLAPRHYIV